MLLCPGANRLFNCSCVSCCFFFRTVSIHQSGKQVFPTISGETTSPCLYPSKNRISSLAFLSLPIILDGSVKLSRKVLFAKSRFYFSTSAKIRLTSCLSTNFPLEAHIYLQFSRLTFLSQIISRGLSELGRGKVRSIAAISSLVSLQFPTALLISLMWSGLPAFGIVKRAA